MSRRRKGRKSRKRLAYGVIAVTFILLCFAAYSYLNPPNQTSSNQTLKAAIVDHLSFKNDTANQTFVDASENILRKAKFNVDYYPGNSVTVDFYRNFAWQNYGLIVLRVHSAIIYGLGDNTSLGLFTSERYDPDNIPPAYYEDIEPYNRIVEAYFTEEEREQGIRYFAIAPGFIEKYATFQNTTIIMMGCDGLKYDNMAKAFINKGAKVCIAWDGPVSTTHTDNATTFLLQYLAQGNTVEEAVNEVGPDILYNSSLKYYPPTAGNYTIQYTLGISSMDTIRANTILVKEERKELN